MTAHLSKSKYVSGLQCQKRLWLEINDPDKAPSISASQQRIFDQGQEVGALAREQFPGGLLIEVVPFSLDKSVKATRDAIDNGTTTLYEATFFFNDVYVRADILTKNDDGSWNLIVVKSSTKVKDEYVPDLAQIGVSRLLY